MRPALFDFDGLIVDTEGTSFASWQEVYRGSSWDVAWERRRDGEPCWLWLWRPEKPPPNPWPNLWPT